MNETPSGEDKLAMIAAQLDTIDRVGHTDLVCPYCHSITSPGKSFCCPTMIRALGVLIDARDKFTGKTIGRYLN
jgi:hypothetical protein